MTADFGQPAPKARRRGPWRRHVLTYVLVGPAAGWAVIALMITVLVSNTGQARDILGSGGIVLLSLVVAYVLGCIPAACTGLVSLRFRGQKRWAYVLATTVAGAVVTGLAAFIVSLFGPSDFQADARSAIGAAVVGGPAALVCALLTMKRPPNPERDLAAVFE